jgi:16S rRNA processing protein RimM
MPDGARICLGQIGAPHGVRGQVRLRSFTSNPAAIAAYGSLQTEDGRILQLKSLRPAKDPAKDHFVAAFADICDRDAAARLANAKLYVPRERLPQLADADEYYHADLIGLAVVDREGRRRGSVVAIHNFGAGDLIEVRLDEGGQSAMLPFDARHVPDVDVGAGRIVISPPAGGPGPARERPALSRKTKR